MAASKRDVYQSVTLIPHRNMPVPDMCACNGMEAARKSS
jgi:hypothetical protein